MGKERMFWITVLIAVVGLLSGQYLAHAADQGAKSGSLVVTSSSATTNVTDLWVVDQANRTVYLCRASGNAATAPTCTKGTQLP